MKQLKLLFFVGLACLMACKPTISNDRSLGKVEAETYKLLVDSLIKDFKKQFNGNMYESEKITPVEIDGMVKVGIPEGTSYMFSKDDTKYVKGDLNNDNKIDLVICANLTEGRGLEVKKYFVYLQENEGYRYFDEFKGDDMVFDNCRNAKLKVGLFKLDSISGGLFVGSTSYQGSNEANYRDYSYRCDTEKYKLVFKTKELVMVSQSDLLKKNDKTGVYEKVEKK